MAGLVPAIHELFVEKKTWTPGTSQDEPGGDELRVSRHRSRGTGYPPSSFGMKKISEPGFTTW